MSGKRLILDRLIDHSDRVLKLEWIRRMRLQVTRGHGTLEVRTMMRHEPRRNIDEKLGLFELIAIAVGGMIGGGIFSVLGLAVALAGNGAPLSFLLAGTIAGLAAYSYWRLCLVFPDDGASYTYLLRAFPERPSIAAVEGWVVIAGYIGTLALYAFTFGAYAADLLSLPQGEGGRGVLSISVLLFFLLVNLRGVRTSGRSEDLIVYAKLLILAAFAVIGFTHLEPQRFTPLFDHGITGVLNGGALIFVAFEGFQLMTNAVQETEKPERNIPCAMATSVVVVTLVYLGLCIVAIGVLPRETLLAAEEYALAEVARPVMGQSGRVLVALAALLATSSAINATLFGASRMMAIMAVEKMMPAVFARRSARQVPAMALVALVGASGVLTFTGGLDVIASFSSLTFLLVSAGVGIANYRLRQQTKARGEIVLLSLILVAATIGALVGYMAIHSRNMLYGVIVLYAITITGAVVWNRRMLV
ncbi:MAG: amino acid permease [Candidatus Dadabacteria bacterium]|nr:MAG: amino acid permease [Candidatus Dadabacteria bacterium]